MEIKKNPNVDARRNSFLYFQVGLVAMLLFTYLAIEYKTMHKKAVAEVIEIPDENVLDEEEVIITMPPALKLPPPPPPAPEVIKVVDDKEIIQEKKIEVTETTEDKPVITPVATSEVGEVGGTAEEIDEEIPFAVIEDAPIFPGCENVAKEMRVNCFQDQIAKHIRKHQQYPEKALEDGIQGRVSAVFVIAKDGSITDVQVRGPKGGELLEKEALRVISKLPKLQPGKQRGKAVKVKFSQPFTFKIQQN